MTRLEYLTQRMNELCPDLPDDVYIEFVPFKGWFVGGEARYIGDDGDFMGANWHDALDWLEWLYRL